MRIMHVLKHAVFGNGHVHVAIDLACAQADAGHDVIFASARGGFDDVLHSHGVKVVDVPEPSNRLSAVRNAIALLSLAMRQRPQIIHAHMMSSAVTAFPVAKLVGARLVTTVHNSFESHSSLMRLGRVVVAVSEAERTKLVGRGFRADRVVTVLNGAIGSPRRPEEISYIGDLHQPSVMTLSGLHPRKGIDVVIRGFGRARESCPDWHLNIVGGGPGREDLERLVTNLDLGQSVHFMGGTGTPEYLLKQAMIFATGSQADPCPLAVTEARGAGCAMVGTAVDGIPELLEDGAAGRLVPPGDVPAMAAALLGLMSDPGALAQARDASARGAEKLSVPRVARDYERVYEWALTLPLVAFPGHRRAEPFAEHQFVTTDAAGSDVVVE